MERKVKKRKSRRKQKLNPLKITKPNVVFKNICSLTDSDRQTEILFTD